MGFASGIIDGPSIRLQVRREDSSTVPPIQLWNMASWTAPVSDPRRVPSVLKTNGTADEQALGRRRDGFSTKIPGVVDGLGNCTLSFAALTSSLPRLRRVKQRLPRDGIARSICTDALCQNKARHAERVASSNDTVLSGGSVQGCPVSEQ